MTNARKSREKHRMEEKQIMDAQFEQERIKAMQDAWEVYECSGNQVHLPSCEGCEIKKLSDLEIEIVKEQYKWQELGMVPLGALPQMPGMPGVPVDTLKMAVSLSALTKMCVDKLGIDEEELNTLYREMFLEKLTTIRENNEEAVKEAHRRQEIAVPGSQVMPQLIVPDHIQRKMH